MRKVLKFHRYSPLTPHFHTKQCQTQHRVQTGHRMEGELWGVNIQLIAHEVWYVRQ